MPQIISNSIKTPDGTVLTSTHVHDFRDHTDTVTGEYYFTDGGCEYIRRSLNKVPPDDLTIYASDPHEDKREVFLWGTYGKDGKGPYRMILLKDMELAHIMAILRTQTHVPKHIQQMFLDEILYRKESE